MDEFKDAISVNEAQAKLNLKSQDDILPGMRVRLLPHQIVGVAWMLEQEGHEEKYGGILADAMGRPHNFFHVCSVSSVLTDLSLL